MEYGPWIATQRVADGTERVALLPAVPDRSLVVCRHSRSSHAVHDPSDQSSHCIDPLNTPPLTQIEPAFNGVPWTPDELRASAQLDTLVRSLGRFAEKVAGVEGMPKGETTPTRTVTIGPRYGT